MDRLWAPWRSKYIKNIKEEGCFLCDAIHSENDPQSLILKRGEHCFIIMNLYPYNNGHLMVAPYRHLASPLEMEASELTELMELTVLCNKVLLNVMAPHGFNIGLNIGAAAGAGLKDHLHQHIVPRWNGDTNFMPVVGRTKIIPQDLYELRDILKKELNRIVQEHE